MKKIFLAVALAVTLSGCDLSEMEFNKQEQAVAKQRCEQVGGVIYFSEYQNSGNPFWASCFVQGFKYQLDKDGAMYK